MSHQRPRRYPSSDAQSSIFGRLGEHVDLLSGGEDVPQTEAEEVYELSLEEDSDANNDFTTHPEHGPGKTEDRLSPHQPPPIPAYQMQANNYLEHVSNSIRTLTPVFPDWSKPVDKAGSKLCRDWTKKIDGKLAEYDVELNNVEFVVEMLQSRLETLRERKRLYLERMHIVSRLHDDILREVFSMFHSQCGGDPRALLAVNKRWRVVALSHLRLWSKLIIDAWPRLHYKPDRNSIRTQEELDSALTRCSGVLLDITVKSCSDTSIATILLSKRAQWQHFAYNYSRITPEVEKILFGSSSGVQGDSEQSVSIQSVITSESGNRPSHKLFSFSTYSGRDDPSVDWHDLTMPQWLATIEPKEAKFECITIQPLISHRFWVHLTDLTIASPTWRVDRRTVEHAQELDSVISILKLTQKQLTRLSLQHLPFESVQAVKGLKFDRVEEAELSLVGMWWKFEWVVLGRLILQLDRYWEECTPPRKSPAILPPLRYLECRGGFTVGQRNRIHIQKVETLVFSDERDKTYHPHRPADHSLFISPTNNEFAADFKPQTIVLSHITEKKDQSAMVSSIGLFSSITTLHFRECVLTLKFFKTIFLGQNKSKYLPNLETLRVDMVAPKDGNLEGMKSRYIPLFEEISSTRSHQSNLESIAKLVVFIVRWGADSDTSDFSPNSYPFKKKPRARKKSKRNVSSDEAD